MLQQRTEEKIMRNSLFKPVIAGCNTCCCCWRGIKKIENKRIVSVLLWTIRADTGRQEGTLEIMTNLECFIILTSMYIVYTIFVVGPSWAFSLSFHTKDC